MSQPLGIEPVLPGHTDEYGTDSSSRRLAWLVADTLRGVLPEPARAVIYMQLGCSHYRRAISKALESAVANGISVSDELAGDIVDWLEAYEGHPEHERITQLLSTARRRTGTDPR